MEEVFKVKDLNLEDVPLIVRKLVDGSPIDSFLDFDGVPEKSYLDFKILIFGKPDGFEYSYETDDLNNWPDIVQAIFEDICSGDDVEVQIDSLKHIAYIDSLYGLFLNMFDEIVDGVHPMGEITFVCSESELMKRYKFVLETIVADGIELIQSFASKIVHPIVFDHIRTIDAYFHYLLMSRFCTLTCQIDGEWWSTQPLINYDVQMGGLNGWAQFFCVSDWANATSYSAHPTFTEIQGNLISTDIGALELALEFLQPLQQQDDIEFSQAIMSQTKEIYVR